MATPIELPTLEIAGLISYQNTHELHFHDGKGWIRRLLLTEEAKFVLTGLISLTTSDADQTNFVQEVRQRGEVQDE